MNENIKTIQFDISIAQKFLSHIKENRIKQISIVKEVGYSKVYVSEVLNGIAPISDSFRSKLNNYLGTNF